MRRSARVIARRCQLRLHWVGHYQTLEGYANTKDGLSLIPLYPQQRTSRRFLAQRRCVPGPDLSMRSINGLKRPNRSLRRRAGGPIVES
jgi:hypothetical protein